MSDIIQEKKSKWELVIGLEVHCQILSKSKLFSSSSTTFGEEPNANVSFIDCALPGVLPLPNKFCIEQAVKTGLALNGTINNVSYFDRKHYFYPDLPFGYQITQFYKPVMENGSLNIDLADGTVKVIHIERLHIEQDAGKLLHDHHPSKSFVDLNRAGVGLMEIVSSPDLRSKEEVATYLNNLRTLLRYLGTCDGNMEEGSMRCDINISVRKSGEPFRTRVEVKNVNSIRFIQQAIEFEFNQQIETWESGKEVIQETKLFNSSTGQTYSLRSKEDAGGYRYMRDPDLLPLKLDDSYIENIKNNLPELPHEKKLRFLQEYKLNNYEATLLTSEKEYADYFEQAILKDNLEIRDAKNVASWITTNLFAFLNKDGIKITSSKISASRLGKLIDITESGLISGKIAKDVFEIMWSNNKDPEDIVNENNLQQITDTGEIESLIDAIILNNQAKVLEIQSGKEKLLGWFVGQVMKESQGKANPDLVNSLLRKKILE
jgi:aspartyl-tRNA(Asn)/glutamyl-tRNA(Gln) amidotransferase subunit B